MIADNHIPSFLASFRACVTLVLKKRTLNFFMLRFGRRIVGVVLLLFSN